MKASSVVNYPRIANMHRYSLFYKLLIVWLKTLKISNLLIFYICNFFYLFSCTKTRTAFALKKIKINDL